MYDIKKLCERDEFSRDRDMAKLREFGTGTLNYVRQLNEKLDLFCNGQQILTKEKWEEVESAVISLRHINWIVNQVEDAWASDDRMIASFTTQFSGHVHVHVARAEEKYKVLRAAIFI